MNKIYKLRGEDPGDELYRRIYFLVSRERGGWSSVGAAFGLAGGVLSFPLALMSWAAVHFIAPAGTGAALSVLSNVFFALPFPLLALGASCLDLLEQKPPSLPLRADSRCLGLEP